MRESIAKPRENELHERMTECILQLGRLAQDDASGWMNILFIVVVTAFWAIGLVGPKLSTLAACQKRALATCRTL